MLKDSAFLLRIQLLGEQELGFIDTCFPRKRPDIEKAPDKINSVSDSFHPNTQAPTDFLILCFLSGMFKEVVSLPSLEISKWYLIYSWQILVVEIEGFKILDHTEEGLCPKMQGTCMNNLRE